MSEYPSKLAQYFVFIKLDWEVLVAFILERRKVTVMHVIFFFYHYIRDLMLKV